MYKRREMPLKIVGKSEKNTDLQFWLAKTSQERVEAVEFLRSQYYALSGYKSIPRIVPTLQIRSFHK
jgi:hypothetical protein